MTRYCPAHTCVCDAYPLPCECRDGNEACVGLETCPAHGPLDDDGGCAGCVAEDRATDAWEGN